MVYKHSLGPTVSHTLYGHSATTISDFKIPMERKKSKLIELPELEAEILQLCIFPEAFESIVGEVLTETKESVIADAVKNLLHYKLLVAANKQNTLSWIYDGDKMRESSFKATADGVEWMEKNV